MKIIKLLSLICIILLLTACSKYAPDVPQVNDLNIQSKSLTQNNNLIPCVNTVLYGFPKPYVEQLNTGFFCVEENDGGYATEYNYRGKVSFWVSEHIIGDQIKVENIKPLDDFRQDPNYKLDGQVSIDDYKGSGFNIGRFASDEDFRFNKVLFSKSSYFENTYPQDVNSKATVDRLNRNVRIWAIKYGELYVLSGAVYLNGNVKLWLGAENQKIIAAPVSIFKVIYAPKINQMIGFIVPNYLSMPSQLSRMAYSESIVENMIGYNLFPLLPNKNMNIKNNFNPNYWGLEQ